MNDLAFARQLRANRAVAGARTFGELASALVERTENPASKRSAVAAFALVGPMLAHLEPAEVTAPVLTALAAWLRTDARTTRGKPLTGNTQHAYYRWVQRALRLSLELGGLEHDPSRGLRPKMDREVIRPELAAKRRAGESVLNIGELRALITDPAAPLWERRCWALCGLAGMRLSEALGLTLDRLEPRPGANPSIVVDRQRAEHGWAPPKGGETREVPLHSALVGLIDFEIEPQALVVGAEPSHETMRAHMRAAVKRLGLPPITPHDLRATFISLCDEAGMNRALADKWTHKAPIRGAASVRDRYSRGSWLAQCQEIEKLRIAL